jgi:eukaryotic-like serine/threonine-protein kinase
MLKPGDRFERYTIEAPLGQGGMGCVYRAHDPRLGRRVALKVISDREGGSDTTRDGDASARLQREARAAAALDHPNAVAIFDVGEHEGVPYIVMELVLGHTLRPEIGDASVSLSTRVAQLADVARALAGAHRRGLVHRDIKPENVMVRDDGMVKVLDFGIARRAGGDVDPQATTQTPALPTLTVEGVKLGTPVYMAPEQIRGDTLDGRADQFAWGVLAHELCTGRLPWRGAGDVLAVVASILTEPADREPLAQAGVPRAVQDVLLRTLAKRPDDRFGSMDDVVRALEAAAKGEPAPAEPPKGATEAQRFSTGEVREVLERALDQQEAARGEGSKLRFEDLLAVAAEVGIDPGVLRDASRAIRTRGPGPQPAAIPAPPPVDPATDAAKRDAWLRRTRRTFYRHAGIYGIINGALLVLGLVLLSFTPWWVWFIPALGWGIGLAIHALTALTANEDDWREHSDQMQWWLGRQQQRHAERMARGERGRRGGRRVEVPAVPPPPLRVEEERLRVADTGRERRAEEEAAVAEEREVERRKR